METKVVILAISNLEDEVYVLQGARSSNPILRFLLIAASSEMMANNEVTAQGKKRSRTSVISHFSQ